MNLEWKKHQLKIEYTIKKYSYIPSKKQISSKHYLQKQTIRYIQHNRIVLCKYVIDNKKEIKRINMFTIQKKKEHFKLNLILYISLLTMLS